MRQHDAILLEPASNSYGPAVNISSSFHCPENTRDEGPSINLRRPSSSLHGFGRPFQYQALIVTQLQALATDSAGGPFHRDGDRSSSICQRTPSIFPKGHRTAQTPKSRVKFLDRGRRPGGSTRSSRTPRQGLRCHLTRQFLKHRCLLPGLPGIHKEHRGRFLGVESHRPPPLD